MLDYLADLADRSIFLARNTYWFIKVCLLKGGYLLLYFASCLIIGFSSTSAHVTNSKFAIITLDFIVYTIIWILTNLIAKNKIRNALNTRKAIGILKIICSFLRLTGTSLLLANTIICINANVGNLALNILILFFTSISLFFILLKEYVILLWKYIKYKAKKELERFDYYVLKSSSEYDQEQ